MAKNFVQKDMLENNNVAEEAVAGTLGRVGLYIALSLPAFLGWIWWVQEKNWFRTQKEKMVEQLANIDAKLTQRFDALTNQLKVAQAALKHEKDLQTQVTEARAAVTGSKPFDAGNVANKNAMVTGLASQWNLVQERYPEIQTMPVMQQLNDTVKDLELDLEAQRRFYSRVARDYNSKIKSYPYNVIAAKMELTRFPMFEAADHKRANVELDFNN